MLRQQSIFAAVLLFISVLHCPPAWCAPSPGTLQWQTNLDDAKRIAAQTNRLVLVHFWSPSCQPCMELEKNVFSQPQVQQFIDARFVPIKINADDAPTTTKRYGITRLPTDLILTPGAQIVGRLGCPLAADAYMQQLLVASSSPAPAAPPNASFAAQPGYGPTSAPPLISNPAPIAATPAANSPPTVGYRGQWTPPNSNAAVEQAYSNDRYSEFFQRYPNTPIAPQQTAPVNSYAATPQGGYAPATPGPTNSNFVSQSPATNSSPYGFSGPQLSMPANAPSEALAVNSSPISAGAPSLGLDGYSPVSLVEQGKWQLGDRRFGAIHRGRTYLFISPDEQQRFLADPDRYSPTASGDDVVMAVDYGQEVPGNRSFGLMYQNRMYLFSSEATEKTFVQNRDRYAAQAMQAENLSRNSIR
jgi:thiol-disulfide isomerase/thioredoxin/YHS domain-containing protein